MVMRFLHVADLHLDSPLRAQALKNPALAASLRNASRQALARIIDAAIEHEVDAVLMAGDIFDSGVADVASRAALTVEIARLGRAGIQAVAIRGNHDALLDLGRYGPIADNFALLTRGAPSIRIGEATLHGIGFEARHVTESLLPDYPAPEPGRLNIGLMHTSLGGAPGHDRYAPVAEADLLAHGYDYWALGHIHQRSEYRSGRALAVMPGIPQGRSIRETGGGSATLVTLGPDGPEAQEIPIAGLRFDTVAVPMADAETQADQLACLTRTLQARARADGLSALRLTLQDAGPLAGDPGFARQLAEEAAEGLPGLFIEAVRFADSAPRTAPGVLADLAEMMRDEAKATGFRDEAAATLDDWRRALPREIADVLGPDALDDLIADGIDIALRRLEAGSQQE